MKLTKWEVERILEALELRIEAVQSAGKGTKNFERLHAKVAAYASMTGKRRGEV